MELRCESKLHGTVTSDHKFEVRCDSRWCGKRPGVVVLHRIDLHTGEVETKYYKDPVQIRSREEEPNGSCDPGSALRAPGREDHAHQR